MNTGTTGKGFTGQKAVFLNMKEDGKKIRASKFKNKKAYNRTTKYRKSDW